MLLAEREIGFPWLVAMAPLGVRLVLSGPGLGALGARDEVEWRVLEVADF